MIVLKSHEEIERMKEPNRIAVEVLNKVKEDDYRYNRGPHLDSRGPHV